MKLLLAGLLMALVLVSELVGMVALTKYTPSTETHLPAQESFTIATAQGGNGKYRLVEWEGSSSCGVWEVQREVESRVNSPESEGGVIGEEGDCKGVCIRLHLATTRHRTLIG